MSRPAEPARGRARSRAAATAEVAAELRTLRELVEVMSEEYRVRVAATLAELLQAIEGDAALGQKPRPLTLKAARAVLDGIRAARLKPKKGRAKDFARMEELVATLTELLPPER